MKKMLVALTMTLAFAGATLIPYAVAFAEDAPASSKKQEKPAKKKGKKSKKGEDKKGGDEAPK